MQLLLLAIFVVAHVCVVTSLNNESYLRKVRDADASQQHTADIYFDVPSVTVQYKLPSKQFVNLEAYRLRHGNGGMKWVSVGYPYIEKYPDGELFESTNQELAMQIKLLDDDQTSALAEQARRLFSGKDITNDDFDLLRLDRLSCLGSFHIDGEVHTLQGASVDSGRLDALVMFPLNKGSPKRQALERFLAANESLLFECEMVATGKQVQQNKLTINSLKTDTEDLGSKLLGPSTEKMVTRDQMTLFAHEVSTAFKVVEDYEIDGMDFAEAFIVKVLGKAQNAFKEEPFESALGKLSSYGMMDSSKSLQPSVITNYLSNVLTVRNNSNKDQIITVRDNNNKGSTDTDVGIGISGGVNIPAVVDASAGSKYTVAHGSKWASEKTSLKDQLDDINKHSRDNVQFEFDGQKIVPKSLMVAKVSKTQLTNSFSFERIRKRISEAQFFRTYALSTADAQPRLDDWEAFRGKSDKTAKTARAELRTQKSDLEIVRAQTDEFKAKSEAEIKALEEVLNKGRPSESGPGQSASAWKKLPGYVKQISAKSSHVYAVTENGLVIKYDGSKWVSAKMYGSQVSAATDDWAWSVWLKGDLYTYRYSYANNNPYVKMSGDEVYVNALDMDTAIGIRPNGKIYKHVGGGSWKEMAPIAAYEASIGEKDEIWAIDFTNVIYKHFNNSWVQVPGPAAKHIDVQRKDRVVITDFDNTVHKWTGTEWKKVEGQECVQASIDHSYIYCVAPSGAVYRTGVGAEA